MFAKLTKAFLFTFLFLSAIFVMRGIAVGQGKTRLSICTESVCANLVETNGIGCPSGYCDFTKSPETILWCRELLGYDCDFTDKTNQCTNGHCKANDKESILSRRQQRLHPTSLDLSRRLRIDSCWTKPRPGTSAPGYGDSMRPTSPSLTLVMRINGATRPYKRKLENSRNRSGGGKAAACLAHALGKRRITPPGCRGAHHGRQLRTKSKLGPACIAKAFPTKRRRPGAYELSQGHGQAVASRKMRCTRCQRPTPHVGHVEPCWGPTVTVGSGPVADGVPSASAAATATSSFRQICRKPARLRLANKP